MSTVLNSIYIFSLLDLIIMIITITQLLWLLLQISGKVYFLTCASLKSMCFFSLVSDSGRVWDLSTADAFWCSCYLFSLHLVLKYLFNVFTSIVLRPFFPPFPTDQDVLDLIPATLDVVQHHVLEDVLPVLQLVHPVVGVGVEHRPAQELRQRLDEKKTFNQITLGN